MATMDVRNSSSGLLVLWLEPWGEDRWLRPNEQFRIRTDYQGEELAFSVDMWIDTDDRAAGIENMAVWIENGNCYAEVVDRAAIPSNAAPNRPPEIDAPGCWLRCPSAHAGCACGRPRSRELICRRAPTYRPVKD